MKQINAADLKPGQQYTTAVHPNEPQTVVHIQVDRTYPSLVHVTREKYGTCTYNSSLPVTVIEPGDSR